MLLRPEDALKRISACCPLRSRRHPVLLPRPWLPTPPPPQPPCLPWLANLTTPLTCCKSHLYGRFMCAFPGQEKVSLQFPKQFSLHTHTHTQEHTSRHTHTHTAISRHTFSRSRWGIPTLSSKSLCKLRYHFWAATRIIYNSILSTNL